MTSKPKILVSNDDGVHSEGIKRLAHALRALGEVIVVAPDGEQNAASHAITLHKPLRVTRLADDVFSTSGTPTDCINLGVITIMKERPALIVSGINKGENLADDVTYSGTVSAAMEGALLGINSIAISLATKVDFNFDAASYYSKIIANYVLEKRLPEDTVLNVNIPNLPVEKIKGVLVTRQAKRVYGEPVVEKVDPSGKKYYWIGGYELGSVEIENSDMTAVRDG